MAAGCIVCMLADRALGLSGLAATRTDEATWRSTVLGLLQAEAGAAILPSAASMDAALTVRAASVGNPETKRIWVALRRPCPA
jgi:hypothetical protein